MIKPTPWDTRALEVPTWELEVYSEAALQLALATPGHHTAKVAPLADKHLLHDYGFYYCDTLLETSCRAARLRPAIHADASVSRTIDAEQAVAICHGAFVHGRFHRDFNLAPVCADARYDNWLRQLLAADTVYGLYWQGALAGFIGHTGHRLVLHAVDPAFRGRGLAKYWWSLAVQSLMALGHQQVTSSISASNVAVMNLYASLGFSFSHPQDVYHRLVP